MNLLKRLAWLLSLALPFYLVRFKIGPLPTTLFELYVGLFVLLFLWRRGLAGFRNGWERLGRWQWPVIAWFIVTLVAVFVSPSIVTGFGLWRAYVLEPLLVFVILADLMTTTEDQERLRRMLFWSVLPLTLWAVIQFVTGRGIPHPWDVSILAGRRATGPFPYPNALALFVAPLGAWAFTRWLQNYRDRLAGFASLASLISITLARSEGGGAAFVLVALLALLVHSRTSRRIAFGIIGITALALTAFPAVRGPVWREITFHGWSGQVRLFQWRETWQMLKDHPIFGAGFGGYPIVFRSYHKATAIEIFQYPHNILLNFWSETGLFGLIVFVWIVYTWVQLVLKKKGQPMAALAPLLAILIHGLVDVPYFKNDLAMLFWILVFLTTVG